MADLLVEDLGKTFAPGVRALDDVSFHIAAGECVALVGPSGCGKTTLLRIIAGLETQTEGDIHIGGVNVNETPPHRRDVALLIQRPAFLMQQTVRQNLRMAWTLQKPLTRWFGGTSDAERDLLRIAAMLGLEHDLDRPLQHLSGGQQQRVGLGRCLLRKAKLTLLDEPLGHLDAPLRTDLRRQIRSLARELGLTVLHVTHDPAEALAVGDRVAVLRGGRLLQIDEPRQMRRFPAHRFVAELIHHEDGGLNLLTGELVKDGAELSFDGVFGRWPVSLHVLDRLRESLYKGEAPPVANDTVGVTGVAHALIDTAAQKNPTDQEKVHIMTGIPAAEVHCTTSYHGVEEDIRIQVMVQDMECSADGTWVIGVPPISHGKQDLRWIGHAEKAERLERGQPVTMTFSMNGAYWFDATTGRTLCAPTG